MRNVSNQFKEYISTYGREINLRITLADGTILTGENDANENGVISMSKIFQADFFKSTMVQIKGELRGRFDLTDQEINVELGVRYQGSAWQWCDYGKFIVKEHTRNVGVSFDTTSFTAYDFMLKTHIDYSASKLNVTYPISVFNLLKAISENIIGIPLATNSIPNGNKIVEEDKWANIEDIVFRDVVDEIAKTCSASILVRDGKLDVAYFDSKPDETLLPIVDENQCYTMQIENKYGPINMLTLVRTGADNYVYPENFEEIPEDERCEIVMEDVEIMNKSREQYAPALLNAIENINYYPFETETQGMAYLDPMDMINVVDLNGQSHITVLMESVLDITTGLKEKLTTTIPSTAKEKYAANSDIRKKYLKVSLIVDQQNGMIESLVKQQDETNDKLTQITQDVDSITQVVEEINNHNIILNFNGENGLEGWTFTGLGLLPEATLLPSSDLLPYPQDYPTFIVKEYPLALSEKGLYFNVAGSAITDYARVYTNGEQYSFRTRRMEATGRFKVYLQEFAEDKSLILERRMLDAVVPKQYEQASITLGTTTHFVRLRIESFDNEFSIAESMFNRGNPKEWERSSDDVYMYAKAEIKTLSDEIELRVTKDGVVSSINLSPEAIKILADKISLEGLTTINDNFKVLLDGSIEAINGKFSGDITASTVIGALIEGSLITGSRIEVINGMIGNFVLDNGVMTYTSDPYEREYTWADLSAIRDMITYSQTPTEYELYIYDVNGSGTITPADYVLIKNYLNGSTKPKKPMIQSQIIIGSINGEFTSNVLYNGGQIGLSSRIQAESATLGTVDVTGLSIGGRSVEADTNGFLKLI